MAATTSPNNIFTITIRGYGPISTGAATTVAALVRVHDAPRTPAVRQRVRAELAQELGLGQREALNVARKIEKIVRLKLTT